PGPKARLPGDIRQQYATTAPGAAILAARRQARPSPGVSDAGAEHDPRAAPRCATPARQHRTTEISAPAASRGSPTLANSRPPAIRPGRGIQRRYAHGVAASLLPERERSARGTPQ